MGVLPRFVLVGSVEAGKSTLFKALTGQPGAACKTQALEFDPAGGVDTPGEFFDHPRMYHALINTLSDAEVLIYVHPANEMQYRMPSGLLDVYRGKRLIGVISKTDLPDAAPEKVEAMLRANGFDGDVFRVSILSTDSVAALKAALAGVHGDGQSQHGANRK